MKKLLLIGMPILILTIGFVVWRLIFGGGESGNPLALPANFSITNQKVATSTIESDSTLESRVAELEFSVSALLNQTPKTSPTPNATLDVRVKALETGLALLTTRVTKLEGGTSTTSQTATTTTTTGAKVAYIPVGYTGSGNSSTDYADISGQEITIDTGNYPGYKSMTLETNFRIYQGNGTGYVRFANKTDGTALQNSVVSTTSEEYSTKTSGGFTIASGSKTYVIQAKSSTGYSVDLQWSRIRVDF